MEKVNTPPSSRALPSAIYVWLVPSEDVLEQPGSWRIRKWDTTPFPEANFTALSESGESGEVISLAKSVLRNKDVMSLETAREAAECLARATVRRPERDGQS